MGSPLGAANFNSLLQGAASLERLGTTELGNRFQISYASSVNDNCKQAYGWYDVSPEWRFHANINHQLFFQTKFRYILL